MLNITLVRVTCHSLFKHGIKLINLGILNLTILLDTTRLENARCGVFTQLVWREALASVWGGTASGDAYTTRDRTILGTLAVCKVIAKSWLVAVSVGAAPVIRLAKA